MDPFQFASASWMPPGCAARRGQLNRGKYKFSVFGSTYQDFAPLDDSYKYMGARMKMTLVGAEATGLTFNGGIK